MRAYGLTYIAALLAAVAILTMLLGQIESTGDLMFGDAGALYLLVLERPRGTPVRPRSA